jgi:hypothetical protein
MYFKIDNTTSPIYQKLFQMRIEELEMSLRNKKAITEITGLEWVEYLGYSGQQNFHRVTQFSGFKFTEPEKVNLKIWKRHKKHNDFFVPNKWTNLGREMEGFLLNGLEGRMYDEVFEAVGLESPAGRFSFPFMDICGSLILLFLGGEPELKDENIIEITKTEFNNLLKERPHQVKK